MPQAPLLQTVGINVALSKALRREGDMAALPEGLPPNRANPSPWGERRRVHGCPVFYLRGSPWYSCPKFSPVRGYKYLMYCSTICWFLWEEQRAVSPQGGKGQESFARGFREAPALSYTGAFPQVFPPSKGIKVPWISSLRKSASRRNNGQVSAEFKDFSGEAQRAKPRLFPTPLKQSLVHFADLLGNDFSGAPLFSSLYLSLAAWFWRRLHFTKSQNTPSVPVVLWRRLSLTPITLVSPSSLPAVISATFLPGFRFIPTVKSHWWNFIESRSLLLIYGKAEGRQLGFFSPHSQWVIWDNANMEKYVAL